jgi:hypothetical protein
MNITPPSFVRDIHFREISPKEGKHVYRFVTKHVVVIPWSGFVPRGTKLSFRDKNGREWLYMDHDHIIIHNRYAWDGCSPKIHIPIFGWVGTPDFEKTILASLIHDALCQFQHTEHFPLSRLIIDNIFLYLLKINNFPLATLYYGGVRVGSYLPSNNNNVYSKLILTGNA